jgi:hypothetical protein
MVSPCRHPTSIATRSADLPTSVQEMLTTFEKRIDPSSDLKMAVDMWSACMGTVEGHRSLVQAQPAFIDNRAQAQGGRAHDPGLPPGRGGRSGRAR